MSQRENDKEVVCGNNVLIGIRNEFETVWPIVIYHVIESLNVYLFLRSQSLNNEME